MDTTDQSCPSRSVLGPVLLNIFINNEDSESKYTLHKSVDDTKNSSKVEVCRFRLNIKKKLLMIRVVRHWNKLLKNHSISGSVEDQDGLGFEQHGLVKSIPAHGSGVGTRW